MQHGVEYLGLSLKNPLIASASPVSLHTDLCKELEKQGIAAVVMHSLFEEAVNNELHELDHMLFHGRDSFAEALRFFPEKSFESLETDHYLEKLTELKKELDIPVIASLNGVSTGGWVKYARYLEEAGADALELNLYYPADRAEESCESVEETYVQTVEAVHAVTKLPLAVKLSPYFTSMPHLLHRLEDAGADAAIFFNRFYLPDIDLENLRWTRQLYPSNETDLSRALRAAAINYGRSELQFCISGGVRRGTDIIKAVMAGATAVSVATVIKERGVSCVGEMLRDAAEWMEMNGYDSFERMRGAISYAKAPNPGALERADYIEILLHDDWFGKTVE